MSAPSCLFSSYPFQIPERLEKSCDTVTMVPILILEFVNFGSKAGVILSITSWAL